VAAVVATRAAMTTIAVEAVVEDGAISSLVVVATPVVVVASPTVVEATVAATRSKSSSLRGARACRHEVVMTISD